MEVLGIFLLSYFLSCAQTLPITAGQEDLKELLNLYRDQLDGETSLETQKNPFYQLDPSDKQWVKWTKEEDKTSDNIMEDEEGSEKSPFNKADLGELDNRQNNYDDRLGGKRESSTNSEHDVREKLLEALKELLKIKTKSIPQTRQHWSYGMRPGGKRSDPAWDVPHFRSKRQHWSKGWAPGGKRSVDMNDFEEAARIKRSGGMQEKVFRVEQPKPVYDNSKNLLSLSN